MKKAKYLVENDFMADPAVHVFDGKLYIYPSHVNTLMEDKQGNLWAGLYQRGIYFIPNYVNKFEYYGFSSQGITQNSNCILSILIDKAGGMWVGSDGDGLFYKQKGQAKIVNFHKGNSACPNSVSSLYQDEKGTIWIGSMTEGLFICNGTSIRQYPGQAQIGSNKVMAIKGDARGNIWVGTYDGGIAQIHDEPYQWADRRV